MPIPLIYIGILAVIGIFGASIYKINQYDIEPSPVGVISSIETGLSDVTNTSNINSSINDSANSTYGNILSSSNNDVLSQIGIKYDIFKTNIFDLLNSWNVDAYSMIFDICFFAIILFLIFFLLTKFTSKITDMGKYIVLIAIALIIVILIVQSGGINV